MYLSFCLGLADAFILMRYPFESPEAQLLNKQIFETIYYAGIVVFLNSNIFPCDGNTRFLHSHVVQSVSLLSDDFFLNKDFILGLINFVIQFIQFFFSKLLPFYLTL